MIQSIFRGWYWIVGAAVIAALVISLSWMANPEVFRTTVELRIVPWDEPELWYDSKALERAIASKGKHIIGVVMGGEVKEAVGQSSEMPRRYGINTGDGQWREMWTKAWARRVMVAGPVGGVMFLIVDDEDGERGVAMAEAVLEALESEWRRRTEGLRHEGLARIDRRISEDLHLLAMLIEQSSVPEEAVDRAGALVLIAQRDLVAERVAELRIQQARLKASGADDPLPWMVVGRPLPYEHHIRRSPRLPLVLSALAFVFLVAIGWVAYDSRSL